MSISALMLERESLWRSAKSFCLDPAYGSDEEDDAEAISLLKSDSDNDVNLGLNCTSCLDFIYKSDFTVKLERTSASLFSTFRPL